jgi:hypothetical protein
MGVESLVAGRVESISGCCCRITDYHLPGQNRISVVFLGYVEYPE